ncbi:BatD family protein [Thalassotalea fonticola]|uniref:BatD family protein n=1 Tax=Thalassotalea fonticola TaxID=3065649 RepID=A0ABZ0GP73_9GAMM|nr:BatD family protein [Colwelliaceae bacterium S1-1]
MVKTIKHSVFIVSLLATFLANALTNVTASIDKNPAVVNESIVLTIVADDSVSADAFDPSILQKDFVVGGTSVSSQTNMVNFDMTRTTQWTTLLIPRKKGKVVIPALSVDGVSTQPIALVVLAENEKGTSQQKDLYITSDVSNQEVYVQQQFTLRVRLHLAVNLKRGVLTEPKMTGAEIKQIGQDQENTQIIDGKRYRIIERVYSVKPQTSGKFVLHSSTFEGEITISNKRSLFSGMDRGKPVSIRGKEIDINVKPMPDNYSGEWLPSELINIEDEWPSDGTEFELGEPITRKVTITAAALSAEQLPELNFEVPSGLKIYPDQAESQSGVQNGLLISQKVQEFAIVPTKPGTYTLPDLVVPWWNTKLNKLEQAVIPGKTITINGIEAVSPTFSQSAQPQVQIVTEQNTTLQWLFLAGWILTVLTWFYTAKLKGKISFNKATFAPDDKQSYLKLLAACTQNNGEQVIALLPTWAKDLYPNEHFANLEQVSKKLNSVDFNEALAELQRNYYSANTGNWQGAKLLKIISRLQTKTIQEQQVAITINP